MTKQPTRREGRRVVLRDIGINAKEFADSTTNKMTFRNTRAFLDYWNASFRAFKVGAMWMDKYTMTLKLSTRSPAKRRG